MMTTKKKYQLSHDGVMDTVRNDARTQALMAHSGLIWACPMLA